MVQHIVMYWMKDRENETLLEETIAKLNSMRGKIPGLLSIQASRDGLHSPRSCDLCLVTTLESFEALEKYRVHPVHLPVQAHMHSVVERSASADFEMEAQ